MSSHDPSDTAARAGSDPEPGTVDPRFGGIARLYGRPAVAAFARAHVAVIGIGGVGSWAAEALARSGVGTITLVDLDDVCVTNSNRQIHAHEGNIGRPKVQAMAARIRAINPACAVRAVEEFVSRDNLRKLVTPDMHFVIDAIDVAGTKAALIYHCKREKIPVITTGAAGGQLDPTQIRVVDLNRTTNDPLAAKVRSILRRHYNWSRNPKRHYSVPCVYSLEQLRYPAADGSVSCEKSWDDGPKRLDCESGFGAAMTVTATFGLVAAARVLDRLAAGSD
ncbi:MAG: tRNA cyclic N6-threonylcarbamoyladenosine(37) synthase TcdA [Pseudomonadota bacterium]